MNVFAVKFGVSAPKNLIITKEEKERNLFLSLSDLKGSKLKKEFHKNFPKAHYSRPPFGHGERAMGMWKDDETGIGLLCLFNGGFEMF